MKFLVLSILFGAAAAEVFQFPIGYRPTLKMRKVSGEDVGELATLKKGHVLNSGATPVIDYEDMAYMIQITLGTPRQTFVVFLDSGSSNLWIPDISCASGNDTTCGTYCKSVPYDSCITFCQDSCCTKPSSGSRAAETDTCKSKHRFDSSRSSTYVKTPGVFDMTYQTGEVKGFFGTDNFCFANTTTCADSQTFGQATDLGSGFVKQPEDGIIGLGWPSLAYNNIVPPLFNLLAQSKLDQPIFVVHLSSIGPTSSINGGTFTVGALDTAHCSPTVNYIPLTSNTFWQFKMTGIGAGSFSSQPASGWQAASDTAATFIGGPKSIVDSLAKAVGAKYVAAFEAYFIDCDAQSPDITLTINNIDYKIPASSYIVSAGAGPCMFAFYTFSTGGFYPAWMLGPPLMRQYCQVHDMKNAQLGMAAVLTN